MNGQSWLWFVHSMQVFAWNGVHRRNMPPTVAPGAPEPVRLQPPPPHEPVRSGFPLGSLGVGTVVGSTCGAPPPRPPGPCAATEVARSPTTINVAAFIALLTFHQPSARWPERA